MLVFTLINLHVTNTFNFTDIDYTSILHNITPYLIDIIDKIQNLLQNMKDYLINININININNNDPVTIHNPFEYIFPLPPDNNFNDSNYDYETDNSNPKYKPLSFSQKLFFTIGFTFSILLFINDCYPIPYFNDFNNNIIEYLKNINDNIAENIFPYLSFLQVFSKFKNDYPHLYINNMDNNYFNAIIDWIINDLSTINNASPIIDTIETEWNCLTPKAKPIDINNSLILSYNRPPQYLDEVDLIFNLETGEKLKSVFED